MRQGLLRYRCLCGNSHNLMSATLDETQARRISDLPATLKSAMLPRRLRRVSTYADVGLFLVPQKAFEGAQA